MAESTNQPAESRAEIPRDRAEINALIQRAAQGDRSCLPQLRAFLTDPGLGRRYLDQYGNPPDWFFTAMVGNVSGKDLVISEAFRIKYDEVRDELSGPEPPPLERLLAERAALCWAEVNIRQATFERSKDLTLRQSDHHQRRIDAAHRRFLSALKTLATVRKLALPALRINVARNQVNLG